MTLTELDPRLTPSASPFPDAPAVPYTIAYLADGGLIAAAGDGGEANRRAQLPRLILGEIGDPYYFVASGPSVSLARSLPRYFEAVADSLDPVAIAARIKGSP